MIVLNSLLTACQCFFGGSLVLTLALLLSEGKAASQRHLILSGAFAVLLALPLASLALPSHLVWHLAAPQTAVPETMVAAAPAGAFDWSMVVLGLALLWAMGVIFVLSKAVFGAVALSDLYRASVPHIPHGLAEAKFRGLNWQLRIRTRPGDAGPITWGIWRPIVLLPKSSVTWSRARLEAVLLHEAAHVRRRDCLTRLIAVLACAFYWPNPLVWIAARLMRRDGETAADDMVLSTGIKASAYAEHLVGLARAFAPARPSYAGVSLAMAEAAMLDGRVEAILNPSRSRKAIRTSDVLKIAALGLTATAVMALARPSLAEAKPEAVAALCPEVRKSALPHLVQSILPADASEMVDDIPPAPPAPPAPTALQAPPAPTALPAPPSHITMRWEGPSGIKEWHWDIEDHNRAEVQRALAVVRAEQHHAVVLERAEIHRAAVQAHMDVANAMREHAADFAKAQADLAKAQAEVHAALAKANISVVVSRALDKAMAKALKEVRPAIAHNNAKGDVDIDDDKDE